MALVLPVPSSRSASAPTGRRCSCHFSPSILGSNSGSWQSRRFSCLSCGGSVNGRHLRVTALRLHPCLWRWPVAIGCCNELSSLDEKTPDLSDSRAAGPHPHACRATGCTRQLQV